MENQLIYHAHDKFFKAVVQIKQSAIDYLTYFAPIFLRENVSLKHLTLDPTNYISGVMAEFFSDVVYRTVWKHKKGEVAIVLLFEHKISSDANVYEQPLNYMLAIWAKDRLGNRPLTRIIPIIFYQGKKPWIKKPFSAYFKESIADLDSFVPNFDYVLVSVENINDQDLLKLSGQSMLASMMLAVKKSGNRAFIARHFSSFFKFSETRAEWNQMFHIFVQYLSYQSPFNLKQWKDLSNQHLPFHMSTQVNAAFETMYQQSIRIGKAEGKAEAKVENIERLLLREVLTEEVHRRRLRSGTFFSAIH